MKKWGELGRQELLLRLDPYGMHPIKNLGTTFLILFLCRDSGCLGSMKKVG